MTRDTNDAGPRVLVILIQNVGEKMGTGMQIRRRKSESSDDPT
jgi:hypothetical protein